VQKKVSEVRFWSPRGMLRSVTSSVSATAGIVTVTTGWRYRPSARLRQRAISAAAEAVADVVVAGGEERRVRRWISV
jgi:hypothetical protein